MTLDNILLVFGALIGWPALVALVIDILKFVGVVVDGTAGKWSLAFNLLGFLAVGVAVGFYPDIDIAGLDLRLLQLVQIAAYIFTVLTQILATRGFHFLYLKTSVGKKFFTYNGVDSELDRYDEPDF
jgi:hypothetical protein